MVCMDSMTWDDLDSLKMSTSSSTIMTYLIADTMTDSMSTTTYTSSIDLDSAGLFDVSNHRFDY